MRCLRGQTQRSASESHTPCITRLASRWSSILRSGRRPWRPGQVSCEAHTQGLLVAAFPSSSFHITCAHPRVSELVSPTGGRKSAHVSMARKCTAMAPKGTGIDPDGNSHWLLQVCTQGHLSATAGSVRCTVQTGTAGGKRIKAHCNAQKEILALKTCVTDAKMVSNQHVPLRGRDTHRSTLTSNLLDMGY